MPAQRRLICHINHTQCVQRKATRGKTHLNVANASAAHNSNAADGQNDEAQSEQLLLLVFAVVAAVSAAVVAATASAIAIENCQLDSNKAKRTLCDVQLKANVER